MDGSRHALGKRQGGWLGQSPLGRFLLALGGILTLAAVGTLGYIFIERMSFLDALYMTVITISTVGFGEVKRLSPAGRLFTIFLIVFGVGNALYLLAVIAELVIEGRLREYIGVTAMQRRIHALKNHVILCGFGRFGRVVAEELLRHSVPVVVVDPNPATQVDLNLMDIPHIISDATRDEVLEEAGVRWARAVVAATGSDADNLYITLSAREKSPSIAIHARAESEAGMRRLALAGANQVISAYQHGGMRVAATIVRPSVVDFLELATPGRGDRVDLEQLSIAANSRLVGLTIEAIEGENRKLRIVALKRGKEPIALIPDAQTRVAAGDYLVVIGDRASLQGLAGMLGD